MFFCARSDVHWPLSLALVYKTETPLCRLEIETPEEMRRGDYDPETLGALLARYHSERHCGLENVLEHRKSQQSQFDFKDFLNSLSFRTSVFFRFR